MERVPVEGFMNVFQLGLFYRYTVSAQNSPLVSMEVKKECLLGSKWTPLSRMKTGNTQIIFTQLAAKSKSLRYTVGPRRDAQFRLLGAAR